uniref:ORFC1 n=2 Tax=Mycoplasmopsis fermentans TaxID=2115 RepID=Q9RFQ0_MYCFE|nr:ORFC1 [Mycoplasmopsis fermentans]
MTSLIETQKVKTMTKELNNTLKTQTWENYSQIINGAPGLRFVKKTDGKYGEFQKTTYWQGYSMVPGNSEYGGWLDSFGYSETYKNIYDELKKILANPKYQAERTIADIYNEN